VTENAAVTPVTVGLAEPLFGIVDGSDAAAQMVEGELGTLFADLGVAGRPAVQFEPQPAVAGADIVTIRVANRRCRFPSTRIAAALAYVDDTSRVATTADAVMNRLHAPDAVNREAVTELLSCLCRFAISSQPGLVAPNEGTPYERASNEVAPQNVPRNDVRVVDVEIDPPYLTTLVTEDHQTDMFPTLRDGLFVQLGLPLPPCHLRLDHSLRARAFAFRVNTVRTIPQIGLSPDEIFVNDDAHRLALLDVQAQPTLNPATLKPAAITSSAHRDKLEAAGFTTWGPFEFLILSLAAAVRQHSHLLMDTDVAAQLMNDLGSAFPAVARLTEGRIESAALVTLLRDLLLDGVSVRNLRRILELMLRYGDEGDDGRDVDGPGCTTFVRWGMSDVIAHTAARGTSTIIAYLLAPEIEAAVGSCNAIADDEELCERVLSALRAETSHLPPMADVPVLLTRDALRTPLRSLLRNELPHMRILGYGDIPAGYNVQPVARISWS
jgi:type III secretion protein V